jgi:hypothetical protein
MSCCITQSSLASRFSIRAPRPDSSAGVKRRCPSHLPGRCDDGMDSTQARHRVRTVQDLPDEALERILARVPTVQARCGAAHRRTPMEPQPRPCARSRCRLVHAAGRIQRLLLPHTALICRVSAAAVCRAWRQLLADRNLRLWQASLQSHLLHRPFIVCKQTLGCEKSARMQPTLHMIATDGVPWNAGSQHRASRQVGHSDRRARVPGA